MDTFFDEMKFPIIPTALYLQEVVMEAPFQSKKMHN
jgi:hypothetical protein